MASTPTLFLLFLMLPAAEVIAGKNHPNIISLSSSLSPKNNSTSWVSASGRFAFGFYNQGNGFAIGIWLTTKPNITVVWTANRDSPPLSADSTLQFTTDGLLLHGSEKQKEKLINANVSTPAVSASMLDSGNFVLYGNNSHVLWQSFDSPTDTILGGQSLPIGQKLVSSMSKSDQSTGHFTLIMQEDGNLVAYPLNSSLDSYDAYFATMTFSNVSELHLDSEGLLCVRNPDTNSIFIVLAGSTTHLGKNTTSPVYRARLEEDGMFRLYQHRVEKNNGSIVQMVWSAFSDPCKVKGRCGLNRYCSTLSGTTVCECIPGFVPLNGSDMGDCEQNHRKGDCESSTDPQMLYTVTSLPDMLWGGYSYSTGQMMMEACGKSCQEDCDCGAALYLNGSCKKYTLPLVYSRMSPNESSATALFKLPSGNLVTPNHTTTPVQPKPQVVIDNKKKLILILVSTLGSVSFCTLVLAILVFFIHKRQVHSYEKLSVAANVGFTEECSVCTFTFDELVKSTGDFKDVIGRGSSGEVYRGTMSGTNRNIAVKKLGRVVDEGEKEFQAEITAIARTHHRNLVQLIGFCIESSRRLLVYEYMSNGSLADLLFESEMRLSWRQRFKVALDVAKGLLYLHEECEVCIVHCNIKPQNILMDEAWTAKISDFGLAKLLMPEHSRTRTGNENTGEYLAPERQKDASVSVKADIYSYGVVLLEIICGRRSIDVNVSSEDEIMLSSWVYKCLVTGELEKLVADEDVEWKTLERMVKVGLWCVQEDPALRPSMKKVILMLEGLKSIQTPPSPTPL